MATIEDLKADLESYVTSVADIELENSELKRRVAYLESDREHEAKLWMEKLSEGKDSWREQALQYGRNQKQRTILECEKVMQAFQSEMRTQQFSHQTKDSSLLLSSLLRAENSNEVADHQRRVFEAMAFTGATKATVTLQDYDIEDNHISLFNRTDLEVSLIGCSLKFKPSGARYKFPDDTLIMPSSTLSIWFGKEAHSIARNAKSEGSLYWHSDSGITSDFASTVNLVDKNANKARYPCPKKLEEDTHAHLNSHTSLVGRHDHFLRFDHFLRLKNDAFGEPILGHQEPLPLPAVTIKRERDEDSDSKTASQSSSSSSSVKGSAKKRPRHSIVATTSTASNCTASETEDEKHKHNAHAKFNGSRAAATGFHKDLTIVPFASGSPPDPHATPLSVWNVRALTLSLRPYLHSRNQGCLSLKRVIRRGGARSAVAVCVCNHGDRPVDLAGWRLFAMGNPSQELFLPSECHLGANSEITLVSALDEDTLLWAQVASSVALTAVDVAAAAVAVSGGQQAVTPDSEMAGRRESVGLFDDVDNHFRHGVKAGSAVVEADKDSASSMFDSDAPSAGRGGAGGPLIFEVAGLKSLSRGDVLSLHLIDSSGRNICMISSDGHGQVHEEGSETVTLLSRGQLTVFGDSGVVEAEAKGTLLPSFPAMGDIAQPPAGCSIQ